MSLYCKMVPWIAFDTWKDAVFTILTIIEAIFKLIKCSEVEMHKHRKWNNSSKTVLL